MFPGSRANELEKLWSFTYEEYILEIDTWHMNSQPTAMEPKAKSQKPKPKCTTYQKLWSFMLDEHIKRTLIYLKQRNQKHLCNGIKSSRTS